MKPKPPTEEQLIRAAYATVPADLRSCPDIDAMNIETKAIWLQIAKNRIANGWPYPFGSQSTAPP